MSVSYTHLDVYKRQGLIYAEMVSDKGLVYDSKKTKDMLYFEECERPIVQQIFGSDLDTFVAVSYTHLI